MGMNFSEMSGIKQWATVVLGGAVVSGALYFTMFKSQNDKNAAAQHALEDKIRENNELESYRPNQGLTFVRNPSYFVGGLPYIERLEAVVDEDTPLGVMGTEHVYTASKVAAELVVTSFAELYGQPYTILRYGIPFGPRMRQDAQIRLLGRECLRSFARPVAAAVVDQDDHEITLQAL